MVNGGREFIEVRGPGRRRKDRLLRDQLRKHRMLFNVGQIITSEINMDVLFEVIMDQTNLIMDTERSTVFLHDDKTSELWSLVATGFKENEIRVPDDLGVVGRVFKTKQSVIVADAYRNPLFSPEVDRKTGFQTRNILCVPLVNRKGKCVGALQALNKRSGEFVEEDRETLTSISHYIAIALENSKLYEELKDMNKARERVINHLSHELITPLALISGVFEKVLRTVRDEGVGKVEKTIERGRRNVNRLLDLQMKIDDILNRKPVEEKEKITRFIDDAFDLIEELREIEDHQRKEILDKLIHRIESLFGGEEIFIEKIPVKGILEEICQEAVSAMGERDVQIRRYNAEGPHSLDMDRNVLKKVCGGVLKNAIENTPDGGRIDVNVNRSDGKLNLDFKDYGVGITEQNQKMIFSGFFHTQDTDLYSTKRPYEFNAGGAGADLLRAKAFAERYGFSIGFESIRCMYLPEDTDTCPGKISSCPYIVNEEECYASGGSCFRISFPTQRGDV